MNILEYFKKIHTFIFDVDGVLTDSGVLILEDGKLLRRMNTRDGLAMKMAVEAGFKVVIITGGKSNGVIERLKNLGVTDIYSGVDTKIDKYEEFLYINEMNHEDEAGILYMGDDLPDYEVMRRVGLPTCPRDAAHEISNISRYISPKNGGAGCVRDVIEKVLKLNGKWLKEPDPYLGNLPK